MARKRDESRVADAARLYAAGKTIRAVAAEMAVNERTIRRWLAGQARGPGRVPAIPPAARDERRAASAAARSAALAAVPAGCRAGGASPATRRLLAAGLRAAGCTLAEIGDVLGVSREMARQDLLPAGRARARR